MSRFDKTKWANPEFSGKYLDEHNLYLPYRQDFIRIILAYCNYFFSEKEGKKFLDLGCGNGYIAEQVIGTNRIDGAVLLDGSEQMLNAARKRLGCSSNIEYRLASFQDLIEKEKSLGEFDFIFSSLAIHHLSLNEKEKLYKLIFNSMKKNGSFINYDVVMSLSPFLESWYINIWEDWILGNGKDAAKFSYIPQGYKANKDNIPSSLEDQLKILGNIGFRNVECFSKFGIFALFGGTK